MTTSDQNQSEPQGDEHDSGAGTAAESGGAERGGARHGRRRRSGGGGRPEQQRQPQPRQQQRSESGLNLEELRELTELFSSHNLTDFEFENADIRIRLSRNPAPAAGATHADAQAPAQNSLTAMHSAAGAQAATQSPAGGAAQPAAATPEPPEEELHVITSPIVGTFYRSPSPSAESFVKVGSQVESGTVVCIIEAMKLMNEIESDAAGAIAKIYVENGQPVEYGQPLFGVKK